MMAGLDVVIPSVIAEAYAAAWGWVLGTVFLTGSLARAARALGDRGVVRTAHIALAAYIGCIGLAVVAGLSAVSNGPNALAIAAFAAVSSLVWLGVYFRLLRAAAAMLGASAS
jgi:hypothetical protein